MTDDKSVLKIFCLFKNSLPKGGRRTRWMEFRWFFKSRYEEDTVFAASDAIRYIKEYGERTRERWKRDYRSQRTLRGIKYGNRDFNNKEEDVKVIDQSNESRYI